MAFVLSEAEHAAAADAYLEIIEWLSALRSALLAGNLPEEIFDEFHDELVERF